MLARIAVAASDVGLSVRKGPGTLSFHAARVPRRPGLLRVQYDAHVAGAYLIAVTYHGDTRVKHELAGHAILSAASGFASTLAIYQEAPCSTAVQVSWCCWAGSTALALHVDMPTPPTPFSQQDRCVQNSPDA